jgi:cytochrome b561
MVVMAVQGVAVAGLVLAQASQAALELLGKDLQEEMAQLLDLTQVQAAGAVLLLLVVLVLVLYQALAVLAFHLALRVVL